MGATRRRYEAGWTDWRNAYPKPVNPFAVGNTVLPERKKTMKEEVEERRLKKEKTGWTGN
jgi:hypothetical protein